MSPLYPEYPIHFHVEGLDIVRVLPREPILKSFLNRGNIPLTSVSYSFMDLSLYLLSIFAIHDELVIGF
jgi:hypothetical protein